MKEFKRILSIKYLITEKSGWVDLFGLYDTGGKHGPGLVCLLHYCGAFQLGGEVREADDGNSGARVDEDSVYTAD